MFRGAIQIPNSKDGFSLVKDEALGGTNLTLLSLSVHLLNHGPPPSVTWLNLSWHLLS